jgi:hypothetical protein
VSRSQCARLKHGTATDTLEYIVRQPEEVRRLTSVLGRVRRGGWPESVGWYLYVFMCTPGWMVVFVSIIMSYGDKYCMIAITFPICIVQAMYAMTNPVYLETMTASQGTLLNPNVGRALKIKPRYAAIVLVVCAALEDVPQTYLAANYLRYTGASFLPVFSISWSAFRMFGHGLVQLIKAYREPRILVVTRTENPLEQFNNPLSR